MRTVLKTLYALLILVCAANAQNDIDHIATLYPSGYGKLAIDGDTLYINILNGHGVERYDIADPANPTFIDRKEVSGFDQIDFNRRVMAKAESVQLNLIDFGNFDNARIVSNISLLGMRNWKLGGNYLFIMLESDSLKVIGITDPANPVTINTTYLAEIGGYPFGAVFGSSSIAIQKFAGRWDTLYVYRISEPGNIHLIHQEELFQPTTGGTGICEAKGDTMAMLAVGMAGYWWSINFVSYAPNDSSHFPSWGEYANGNPRMLYSNDNSFLLASVIGGGVIAYSFNNFYLLGIGPPLWDPNHGRFGNYEFDCTQNNNFIVAQPESLYFFESTHDSTAMPQISGTGLAHFGILSTDAYANYVLCGAESNGGELLIHELNDANRLSLISTVPTVKANKIIIEGLSAICLCPDKISQVDLTNPFQPIVSHELTGFMGELMDFAVYDSLLFAITNQAYYVIDYDSLSGMTILSQMDFPAGSLTSMGQNQEVSVLLQGTLAHLVKISASNPTLPVIVQERQFPPDTFQNLALTYPIIWVSGQHGTNILAFDSMDSAAFIGPEYFSDVHQVRLSEDTLYVADGANGIRMFIFQYHPFLDLRYIGGYSTGNIINRVSTIRDNFFVSDYYSLQQLRWGAPTGIDNPDPRNIPEQITLMQNYPNPFNARTTISYTLSRPTNVTIEIYDLLGRKIETLVNRYQSAGEQNVVWDAGGNSSGVYFYRIKAGDFVEIKKCVLLK